MFMCAVPFGALHHKKFINSVRVQRIGYSLLKCPKHGISADSDTNIPKDSHFIMNSRTNKDVEQQIFVRSLTDLGSSYGPEGPVQVGTEYTSR
jgi:hypothetical protein